MTEELKNEIINLGLNIFNTNEFNNFINLLNEEKYNTIRLMVDEKVSYFQVINELREFSTINNVQLACANKLEDMMDRVRELRTGGKAQPPAIPDEMMLPA